MKPTRMYLSKDHSITCYCTISISQPGIHMSQDSITRHRYEEARDNMPHSLWLIHYNL